MSRVSLMFLALVGCSGPVGEGTSVGNPTKMVVRAAPSVDVTLTAGEFPDAVWTVMLADGPEIIEPGPLNLVTGGEFELPNGEWDALAVEPLRGITLFGTTRSSDTASMVLEVPPFRLLPRGGVGEFLEDALVLELAFPGWLDEDFAGYDADVAVVVQPGTPEHDRLVSAVLDDSTLYRDGDRDQGVGDEERRNAEEGASERVR